MRLGRGLICWCLACGTASTVCLGLVSIIGSGTWPDTWPKELEPYRHNAKTVEVAHGVQETDYEIPFHTAERFEEAWPHILALKSKGAPLILEESPSTSSVSGSTLDVGVRILCPPGLGVRAKSGESEISLEFHAPWPDSILLPSGDLPEYVVQDGDKWVPFTGVEGGFRERVRTDIVLVVDGRAIDLNRIELPADTPIIDRRFQGGNSH